MAQFSRKILRLLPDYLTDVPLQQIDALFEDNEIALGPPQADWGDSSERRARTRRYLASLNLELQQDRARLTNVYSDLMQEIGERAKRGEAYYDLAPVKARWERTLRDAGFEVEPWTFIVSDPGESVGVPPLTPEAIAAAPDASAIMDHLTRLNAYIDTDPRLAVSTAKALIETTAKCVLTARNVPYSAAERIPALISKAQESLGLSAKSTGGEDQSLRKVLQSLSTLAQSVSEVRNLIGVDHGREDVPRWVRPRHARLVVGAAHVWCQLMLETLGDLEAPWRAPSPPAMRSDS